MRLLDLPRWIPCAVVLFSTLAPLPARGAEPWITIDEPAHNSIRRDPVMTVRGRYLSPAVAAPEVVVWIGQTKYHAAVAAGSWSVAVGLPAGSVPVRAVLAGQAQDRVVATLGVAADVAPQGQQKVHVLWDGDDANRQLISIARSTLNRDLTEDQLNVFAAEVRKLTERLIQDMLVEFDVQLVDQVAGVHLIKMLARDGDRYGYSRGDCGNRDLEGASEVYLGTFATSMREELATYWKPMDPVRDSLEMRKEDVAWALATTAAHELAHGLGLVACGWMQGDPNDDGHNHPNLAFDGVDPRTSRFGNGGNLMDSARYVRGYQRIGQESFVRDARRVPRWLNTFNRAYLTLIHPSP